MGKKHGVPLGGPQRTGLGLTKGDTLSGYLDTPREHREDARNTALAEALKKAGAKPVAEE